MHVAEATSVVLRMPVDLRGDERPGLTASALYWQVSTCSAPVSLSHTFNLHMVSYLAIPGLEPG
jgi:hypothetical protein